MSDKIKVEMSVVSKESPMLRAIEHKAVAGLSETEIIERYTVGEFKDTEGVKEVKVKIYDDKDTEDDIEDEDEDEE